MLEHQPRSRLRLRRRSPRDELLERVQRGESGAFAVFYNRYYRLVHGIALARVPHCEVDDVVQEVFIRIARKVHTVRSGRSCQGWIVQITRNYCIDLLRQRGRRMTHTLPPDTSQAPPRVAEALSVLDAMAGMPESYREILILHFVEGYTSPEIAAQLGMTRGSVRVKLHRGMKLLRAQLDMKGDK